MWICYLEGLPDCISRGGIGVVVCGFVNAPNIQYALGAFYLGDSLVQLPGISDIDPEVLFGDIVLGTGRGGADI